MGIPAFTPFPRLATPRLILRQLEERDAPEIFLLRSNEHVNRYIDRPRAETINDAQQFITRIESVIAGNEGIYWAIVPKNDTKLAGTICLFNLDHQSNKAEIGYELLPDYHGKGIMQEAFSAVVAYGFETMNLACIEAFTHEQNISSIKLLQKNNFTETIGKEKIIENDGKILVEWSRFHQPVTG